MVAGKGRFAFSVAGALVATLLLSFVLALYRGWNERLTAYIDQTDADLWLVQRGAESFFSPSVVNQRNLDIVKAIDGVERSGALVGKTLRMHHGDGAYDVYIMGFDAAQADQPVGGLGGPLHIVRGSGTPRTGEIVIDQILADIAGIDIGDTVTASTQTFKVVGISSGGNLGVTLLCFVDRPEAQRLIGDYPIVSYVLVKTAPGRQAEVAAAIREANPYVDVFPTSTFAESSRRVLRRSILPVLAVVVVLVFVVGSIVVGLTIYTSTIEKQREFGVLKALGTPGYRLVSIVLQQSFVCCLLGFALGEAGVVGAVALTKHFVPQFVTLIKPGDVAVVFVAVLVMGAGASLLPIQRVLRVDPLAVFKA
jgi:putative ABC transport system permease protein